MSVVPKFPVDISQPGMAQILFGAMINAIPGYVTVVDEQGKYLMANDKLMNKAGVSADQFVGASIGFLEADSEFKRELMSFLHKPYLSNHSDVTLLKFKVDDEPRWHLINFQRVHQLKIVICASIDTHEEISLSLEVRRQQEIIESSEKLAILGEMAGGIAHEINNPMAAIDLLVERVRRHLHAAPPKVAEIEKSLVAIEGTVERTVKIVKSLKAFARKSTMDPMEPFDLQTIMETVCVLEVDRYKQKNILLHIDPVPAALIECRETEICQVLVNLMNNAFDAVQELDEKWVRVTFHVTELEIEIRVTDSGLGIPQHVVDKLMTPFFTTKDVGKGTGLGLSLSRKFIENHKGRFYYNNNWPNTQFVVLLPRFLPKTDSEQKAA
jgi:phosphoglycerate-specific signal transduction histidine kinase